MGSLRYLAAGILLIAAAQTALAEEAGVMTGMHNAARTGDVQLMQKLRGADVKLDAKVKRVWRITKGHRDLLIELKHGGETSEALLRLTGALNREPKSKFISATGKLIDFEPYPQDGKIAWQPVIEVITLK